MPLRALVVDDTVLFRRVVGEALGALPGVEVAGSASSGRAALEKIRTLQPDLVTLDIEMPDMDGLEVLDALKASALDVGVIVVSALTAEGGKLTVKALEKGAFDFITKATGGTVEQNRAAIQTALAPRVAAFARRREISSLLKPSLGRPAPAPQAQPASVPAATAPFLGPPEAARVRLRPEMVLVGVSTGGPMALTQLLPALPADFPLPLLVVQHMPAHFTRPFAENLDARCALRVSEAEHLEPVVAGRIYVAPGGRHMKLAQGPSGQKLVHLSDDPPENNCRPAVDVLFRSVAHAFPGRAAAVILTGMGSDGTLGLRLLKRHGGLVLAQDEATCVVYGMPKAAVEAGVVDEVLPLPQIAPRLLSAARGF